MNIEVTQKADGWMLGTIEGGYEWQATMTCGSRTTS